MAVPVRAELFAALRELTSRHQLSKRRSMEARRRDYLALARALPSLANLLAMPAQKLDEIGGRLGRSLVIEVARKRQLFAAPLSRLSPLLLSRSQARRRERLSATIDRLAAARTGQQRQFQRDLLRLGNRLDVASLHRIALRNRERLEQAARLLRSYSYEAVLDRGFALVTDRHGKAVRSTAQVATGDPLLIQVAKGEIGAIVSAGGHLRSRRARRMAQSGGEQGSLFQAAAADPADG
jgi:exodeoxyribonuclease VII large subunit